MMQKSRNPERDIFEAFKVYDTKKQGVISMKDLKHVMMRTGEKLSQQDCKLLFFIDMFYFNLCSFGLVHTQVKLM